MAKVLIVDDDPAIRHIISLTLKQKGYDVISAPNAKSGLDAVKMQKPDCVVLDQILPDMTGIQFLQLLREDIEIKDTPVLIFTAFHTEAVREEAMVLGAKAFLLKFETDPNKLSEIVDAVLKEKQRPQEL